MKTSSLLVAAFTLVAGYSVYQSQQKEQMSDIALENVEALASGEIIPGNTGPSELYDCPFWFTGDGYHCKCENSQPCTAVTCD